MHVDLGDLGLDEGGLLLVKRALRQVAVEKDVAVSGRSPSLEVHLSSWVRSQGHKIRWDKTKTDKDPNGKRAVITRGAADTERWSDAERAGGTDPFQPDAIVENPPQRWGLAARGATVEAGGPEYGFKLSAKSEVWADEAVHLYAQAVAAQWDPNTAVPWDTEIDLPDEIEDAVVQVMTYLIENETAALIVPSRFIAQLHPHFRELMQ